MELRKITNRIYYLTAEERTDRPVLGYIKGDKHSMAVDAGNSSDHVVIFYQKLKEHGLKLPDFTVITHWHWDHTFGMHAVSGKTIAGHLTNDKLGEVQKWEWTDEAMEKRLRSGEDIEFCNRSIKLEYPNRNKIKPVRAEIEFTGEINIDLGSIHCSIKEFIAPHSADSVLVETPEEKTVFIGDADGGDYYENQGNTDTIKLTEMIHMMGKLEVDICIPGHDAPQSKQQFISYLKDELAKSSSRP
jgi:glyoxylase-like metal-dependent hydrolase (beta-lactamase superfamily II)